MPEKTLVKVDPKIVLATPIDRGSFVIKNRTLLRIHIQDNGFTRYWQEANGEAGEYVEWSAATKAAFLILLAEVPPVSV